MPRQPGHNHRFEMTMECHSNSKSQPSRSSSHLDRRGDKHGQPTPQESKSPSRKEKRKKKEGPAPPHPARVNPITASPTLVPAPSQTVVQGGLAPNSRCWQGVNTAPAAARQVNADGGAIYTNGTGRGYLGAGVGRAADLLGWGGCCEGARGGGRGCLPCCVEKV